MLYRRILRLKSPHHRLVPQIAADKGGLAAREPKIRLLHTAFRETFSQKVRPRRPEKPFSRRFLPHERRRKPRKPFAVSPEAIYSESASHFGWFTVDPFVHRARIETSVPKRPRSAYLSVGTGNVGRIDLAASNPLWKLDLCLRFPLLQTCCRPSSPFPLEPLRDQGDLANFTPSAGKFSPRLWRDESPNNQRE